MSNEINNTQFRETVDKVNAANRVLGAKRIEFVIFRYIVCPECDFNMCWVNPRLPTYCPECGKVIYAKLKMNPERIMVVDEQAELHVKYEGQKQAGQTVSEGVIQGITNVSDSTEDPSP